MRLPRACEVAQLLRVVDFQRASLVAGAASCTTSAVAHVTCGVARDRSNSQPLFPTLQMACPSLGELKEAVLDSGAPLGKRMRAAFHLRTIGTSEAVHALCVGETRLALGRIVRDDEPPAAVKDKANGVYMRHELAYVLGQIGDKVALPTLEEVLRAEDEDAMVRHEVRARRLTPRWSRTRDGWPRPPPIQAAEAMGAMAFPESLGLLEQYEHHSTAALAETCQLAISRIRWVLAQQVRGGGPLWPSDSSLHPFLLPSRGQGGTRRHPSPVPSSLWTPLRPWLPAPWPKCVLP